MFKGKKTVLRAYRKEDAEAACRFFNDEEFRSLLDPRGLLPVSLPEEEAFVAESMNPKDRSKAYNFAVTTLQGKYIGGCSYFALDARNRTAYIGVAIGDKALWGKGYGSDALRTLLRLLFGEMNVRKALLNVFAYNSRAIACYKSLGFREEGRLKEQCYRGGKYHDDLVMALFAEDFR